MRLRKQHAAVRGIASSRFYWALQLLRALGRLPACRQERRITKDACLPAGRKDELRKTPACRLAGKTNYGFEGDQGL
ncbi:MAG: hypothetical protein OER04_15830 [Cyclobacteriaceae bacterium]|nr:hypothetical protein [Cyclobacteriaceae bacterium]